MTIVERFESFFSLLQQQGLLKGELIYRGNLYKFDPALGRITVENIQYKPDKTTSKKESKTVLRKIKSDLPRTTDKDTENLKKKIQSSFKPGKAFGSRYTIISKIGQGGMGTVFKAHDGELNKAVALKMVKPELMQETDNINRFTRELEIIRQINHKNVISILNFGDEDGIMFMSMPYIEGISLLEFIQFSGVLSTSDFMKIAQQICLAIQAIHDKDIIHRDLKPQNIMIDNEGTVYVMDFGLARSLLKPKITTTGQIVGTPEFMSPEQIEDKATDLRTDIWSLGVMFYEMLTAELPFKGQNLQSLIGSILKKSPELPSRLNPLIPKILEKLILKCLNKDREKRYSQVKEIEQELRKILKRLKNLETGTEDQAIKLPTTRKRKPGDYHPKAVQAVEEDILKKIRKKSSLKPKMAVVLLLIAFLGIVAIIFIPGLDTLSDEEKSSWQNARQTDSLPAYQIYLQKFPEGKYATEAKERISQFKQDQYRELLKQYERLVADGKLEQALAVIRRARQFGDAEKTLILEKRIQQLIDEEAKKHEEYERLVKLAREKLSRKLFEQALENVNAAKVLNNTPELKKMENDIQQQKKNYLKNKTVKTMRLVNLPVELIRSYYNRLRKIELQYNDPGTVVSGRIFIRFNVDKKGNVLLKEFNEGRLMVRPFRKRTSLVALIKKHLNSLRVKPPTDKNGQPVNISDWPLRYRVEKRGNNIILSLFLRSY